MQGRRAPELAAGESSVVMDRLGAMNIGYLVCAHQRLISPADWCVLQSDFEHGRARAQTLLSLKMKIWSQLPWLLRGLAHLCAREGSRVRSGSACTIL